MQKTITDFQAFRHLVFDVDGTLVTDEKKISPALKSCLIELEKKGFKIYICTGRTVHGAWPYAMELEMDKYDGCVIGMNGSLVQKMDGQVLLEPDVLSLKEIQPLLELWDGLPFLTIAFYMNDMTCAVNKADPEVLQLMVSKLPRFNRIPMNLCSSYKEFRDEDPLKVLFVGKPEELEEAKKKLLSPYEDDYSLVDSTSFFVEVMPKGTDKSRGLGRTLEKEKIDPQKVMAFGDQNNDIEMIEMAGLGIAMGNATDKLKDLADLVIGSNEEDGIARFLMDVGLCESNEKMQQLLLPAFSEK